MAQEEIDEEVRCLLDKLVELKGPVWDGSVVLRLKVRSDVVLPWQGALLSLPIKSLTYAMCVA